ncbi:MAG: AAA family ATPase [Clostridia bacterium]|nr:AAA family ATPase [Clostridia bacterium]
MRRNALSELLEWKDSDRRKPLIIKGARQVGKSWLMEEFAKNYYDDYIYISFDKESQAKKIFTETKDPKILLERISLYKNKPILPEKTLVIFDEIQDCPQAIGSLKYFNEEANEYHIISAGSLIGTYLAKDTSFPVGKVNLIDLYPLTFDEFLEEVDEGMYKYYKTINSPENYAEAFHNRMLELFRQYLIIGGMPECVKSWVNNKNPQEVLEIQKELVRIYESDFLKHNKKISGGKILQVFRNIIPQLAKENNEKFVYSVMRTGARGKDYEDAIEWLITSGLSFKVNNITTPEYPLKTYEQHNIFKLFLLDVGLLKYMAGLDNSSILLDEPFKFKSQLMENYVLEQLAPQMDFTPNYYAMGRNFEINFIIQKDSLVVPIEVKSGLNKKANSFKRYIEKNNTRIAVRFSSNGYVKNGEITNIPLYLASKTMELLK